MPIMAKLVAFLRAINVGGHVVTMSDLRKQFGACGYAKVETFIASGNVIFETRAAPKAAARRIETRLHEQLGYEVHTFVRTADELAGVLAARPFPDADVRAAKTHCVGFLAEPLTAKQQQALRELATRYDDLQVRGREVFWLSRRLQGQSDFSNAALERKLGVRSTFRGMNTIVRLSAKHFEA
jgi:uncharacterized protein (DUF1697 family)